MGFRTTMYGSQKSHYPWLKCHENEEKIDNGYVLRNDHRIKTTCTQPISMILVSFCSEDNVLSDEIKICYIFEYQSNENQAFRFIWDTWYKNQLLLLLLLYLSSKINHFMRRRYRQTQKSCVLPYLIVSGEWGRLRCGFGEVCYHGSDGGLATPVGC